MSREPDLVSGAVAPEVALEFPDLRLFWVTVPGGVARTPEGVRERLRVMSDRFRGPEAVAMRTKPIPWAYRVFFRHIGLDPDRDRTPIEAAALRRLEKGRYKPDGLPWDALTIALVETGVPVWALDSDAVDGELTVRSDAGRLAVTDSAGLVAPLFGDPLLDRRPTKETRTLRLYSVAVAGVPDIHVEEAMWTVTEMLAEEG